MRFKGQSAVVCGASAPGGTGWAIAEALAAEGATVMVAARSLGKLQTLATRIGGHAVACDVGMPDQVAALAAAAKERFGTVDIAINSAALAVTGSVAEADLAGVQQALDVNYIGNVAFLKHMGAVMKDGGAMILISSSSAHAPMEPFFPYACSKAAMDCLVRYAAIEYARRGIRVNSIVPGAIKTDMAADLYAIPGAEAVMADEIPLGRVGLPSDYADAVVWMAGAPFVTGLNMHLSGGNHLTRHARMTDIMAGAAG